MFDISLSTTTTGFDVQLSGAGAVVYKIWVKLSGTFVEKQIDTKLSGTFANKPLLTKVSGTFI